jgi:hypothetical protein
MHFVSLNHFYDFILVLNSIRNHPTKNECFCMHILFTTIYLLHKQKLNHGNYFEHELNMGNFVQDNEYDVHMYTKLQDVCKYRYLLYEFNLILLIFNLYNILL